MAWLAQLLPLPRSARHAFSSERQCHSMLIGPPTTGAGVRGSLLACPAQRCHVRAQLYAPRHHLPRRRGTGSRLYHHWYAACIAHAAYKHTPCCAGSVDGHVKFWKKQAKGVEFAKHFRAHLGPVIGSALACMLLRIAHTLLRIAHTRLLFAELLQM